MSLSSGTICSQNHSCVYKITIAPLGRTSCCEVPRQPNSQKWIRVGAGCSTTYLREYPCLALGCLHASSHMQSISQFLSTLLHGIYVYSCYVLELHTYTHSSPSSRNPSHWRQEQIPTTRPWMRANRELSLWHSSDWFVMVYSHVASRVQLRVVFPG
jgi:hypothetical protein